MLEELYRTGLGGVVYTLGAVAGLALYNASEDNFWACVGVLLSPSLVAVAGGRWLRARLPLARAAAKRARQDSNL